MESILEFIKANINDFNNVSIDVMTDNLEDGQFSESAEIEFTPRTLEDDLVVFIEVEIWGVASTSGGGYFEPLEVHMKANFKINTIDVYFQGTEIEFEDTTELEKLFTEKITLNY